MHTVTNLSLYASAREIVLRLWKDDGNGPDGNESSRQGLLRTLREASEGKTVGGVGTLVNLNELTQMFFDFADTKSELTTDLVEVCKITESMIVHRSFDDDDFSSYMGGLAFRFDETPKEE